MPDLFESFWLYPKPLPEVLPGPKLAPFTATARADINFIYQLSSPSVDANGIVWMVTINSSPRYYALKMVRRHHWPGER
jgi:hypothetical protein